LTKRIADRLAQGALGAGSGRLFATTARPDGSAHKSSGSDWLDRAVRSRCFFGGGGSGL